MNTIFERLSLERQGNQARSIRHVVHGALAVVTDPSHAKIASSSGGPLSF